MHYKEFPSLLARNFGLMIYANLYELPIMKDLIQFLADKDKEWIPGRTALGVYRLAS